VLAVEINAAHLMVAFPDHPDHIRCLDEVEGLKEGQLTRCAAWPAARLRREGTMAVLHQSLCILIWAAAQGVRFGFLSSARRSTPGTAGPAFVGAILPSTGWREKPRPSQIRGLARPETGRAFLATLADSGRQRPRCLAPPAEKLRKVKDYSERARKPELLEIVARRLLNHG
jgi:hypothetical protein